MLIKSLCYFGKLFVCLSEDCTVEDQTVCVVVKNGRELFH